MTEEPAWTPEQIAAWEQVRTIGRMTFLIRTALRQGAVAGGGMLLFYILIAYLFVWRTFSLWAIIWNIQTFLLGLLWVLAFSGIAYLAAAARWASNERRFHMQVAAVSHRSNRSNENESDAISNA